MEWLGQNISKTMDVTMQKHATLVSVFLQHFK